MGCVLVTGATGFLGRPVCRLLAQKGVPFVAIGRSCETLEVLKRECDSGKGGLRVMEAVDLLNPEQVLALARRWPMMDRVIHLASPVPGQRCGDVDFLITGGSMTLHLIALMERLSVRFVSLASSVSVYDHDASQPMTESATLTKRVSAYGLMKQFSEHMLRWNAEHSAHGLAILRLSQIYGPEEPHGLGLTRMIRDARSDGVVTVQNGGEDQRDLTFVDDAARAVVQAAEQEVSGIFNISTGRGYRMEEVARCVAASVDRDVRLDLLPRSAKATRYVYPNQRAERELGFRPLASLEEGIRTTVAAAIATARAAAC